MYYLITNFNTTKENLLNDFCNNATKIIANSVEYFKNNSYSKEYKDHNLTILELSAKGILFIKKKGESSEFYNEIEEVLRYNGGEIFEMSQNDVVNLCYRAGFYF
jgi:hypothetical protein